MSTIVVTANEEGVVFSIDHQTFRLKMPESDPEEQPALDYHQWYAQQLTVALERLAGGAREAAILDEIRIAIAASCDCHFAPCLHDRIRGAIEETQARFPPPWFPRP